MLGALVFQDLHRDRRRGARAAHWVIYVFGAFLIFTAYRLARSSGEHVDPRAGTGCCCSSPPLRAEHGRLPRNEGVFVREHGRRLATPIFAVLIVVASTDVVFAIDSIPAIFAITDYEAFIVLAANIFAVMGLRAAYFLIVGALDRFEYLHYGLAVVLGVVGLKMLTSEVYDPPVWMTLGAVVVILGASMLVSLWATRNASAEPRSRGRPGGADAVAVTGGGSAATG